MSNLLYNNYEYVSQYKKHCTHINEHMFDIQTTTNPLHIYEYFSQISCFKIDYTEVILCKLNPYKNQWVCNVFFNNEIYSDGAFGLIENWTRYLEDELFDINEYDKKYYEIQGISLKDFEFISYNLNILIPMKISLILLSRLTQPNEYDLNCQMTQKISKIIFSNSLFEDSPGRVDLDNLVLEIFSSCNLDDKQFVTVTFPKNSLGKAFQKMLLDSSYSYFFKNNNAVRFLTAFY